MVFLTRVLFLILAIYFIYSGIKAIRQKRYPLNHVDATGKLAQFLGILNIFLGLTFLVVPYVFIP